MKVTYILASAEAKLTPEERKSRRHEIAKKLESAEAKTEDGISYFLVDSRYEEKPIDTTLDHELRVSASFDRLFDTISYFEELTTNNSQKRTNKLLPK